MAEIENKSLGPWRMALQLVVVLLLLAMASVRIAAFLDTGYPINRLALIVARVCLTSGLAAGGTEVDRNFTSVGEAWLWGMIANCQGQQGSANAYWLQMLSISDLRLHVLRAAAPQAVELAKAAVAADSDHPDKATWLGDTLLAQGDERAAAEAYTQGLEELGGTNGNAWRKLGDLYLEADDWQNAVYAYSQACLYVDRGKIAELLAGIYQNQEESFYEDISYCPPAHCLLISSESVRKWRYWDVDPQARIRYQDDRDYAAHFLELLTEAVRCRLRTVGPVGVSLSGGLDSTTLAAITSGLLPQTGLPQERLKSFSYVFDELTSCDERRYIQPIVDHYQLDANYIPCDDKWTLRDIQEWPVYKEYVWADPFVLLPLSVMQAAQHEGCRLLLAGYYGDTLDIGGQFWAAGMLADLRLGQLARVVMKQRAEVDLRRDILINGLRHMVPQRLRMLQRRYQSGRDTTIHPGIHPQLVESTHLGARLYADEERRANFGPDQWHRYLDLTLNVFAQGACTVRSLYNRYGLELSTPYWDRRLIEYVLAIPADQLGRPQRNRWLMRNAASGLLPKAVRERRQKTTFVPLMEKGLLFEEKDVVERIMNNPLIVKQQYVNADWLRQQLQGGRGWSDDRHSFFLWNCLSLELWLSLLSSARSTIFTQGDSYE